MEHCCLNLLTSFWFMLITCRWRDLKAILQQATRGWSVCFAFNWGECSCTPSLFYSHWFSSKRLRYKLLSCLRGLNFLWKRFIMNNGNVIFNLKAKFTVAQETQGWINTHEHSIINRTTVLILCTCKSPLPTEIKLGWRTSVGGSVAWLWSRDLCSGSSCYHGCGGFRWQGRQLIWQQH